MNYTNNYKPNIPFYFKYIAVKSIFLQAQPFLTIPYFFAENSSADLQFVGWDKSLFRFRHERGQKQEVRKKQAIIGASENAAN